MMTTVDIDIDQAIAAWQPSRLKAPMQHSPDSPITPMSCITDTFSFAESDDTSTCKSFSDVTYDDDEDNEYNSDASSSECESYYYDQFEGTWDTTHSNLHSVNSFRQVGRRPRYSSYDDCIDSTKFLSICTSPVAARSCIELTSPGTSDTCKEVSFAAPTVSCRIESVSMLDLPEFIPDDDDTADEGSSRPRRRTLQENWAGLLKEAGMTPPPLNEIHPALRNQDPLAISRETMRQEWTEWPPVKLNLVVPTPPTQGRQSVPPHESPRVVEATKHGRSESAWSAEAEVKPKTGRRWLWGFRHSNSN
ncbi:hypothetical protein EDC01DRAFT_665741 [Geopyxis carbonaria]|nr:hypothetical protein EDC01DRAFT_665741 [Geopyxis carbonaria]